MKKINAVFTAPFSFACLFLLLIITGRITAALPAKGMSGLAMTNIAAALLSAAAFALGTIPLKYTEENDETPSHTPRISLPRSLLLSLAALAVLFAVSLASSLLLPGQNSSSAQAVLDALPPSGAMRVLVIVSLIFRHALVPALTEELYFRHKLSGVLLRGGINPTVTLISTSLMFGFLHRGGIAPVLLAAVSGAILWLLTRLTGRIVYPIAVHFIYNLIIIITMAI